MSRSGYIDDYCDDQWAHICYRGAVMSALRGKRGQAFLRELLEALDTLPEKKLISGALINEGAVCAIGALGLKRGVDLADIDPEEAEKVARAFGVAESLAREVVYENDEAVWAKETDEQRFTRMRKWVASYIIGDTADA